MRRLSLLLHELGRLSTSARAQQTECASATQQTARAEDYAIAPIEPEPRAGMMPGNAIEIPDMLVRDALVASPFVVAPTTTMFELIDGILGGNQTTASVVEHGRLLGTVSALDVLKQLVPPYVAMDEHLASVLHATFFEEALGKLHDVIVGDVMEREVLTLSAEASVMRAVAMFVQYRRKTIPVTDKGRFLGSVTRRSVLRLIRSTVGS